MSQSWVLVAFRTVIPSVRDQKGGRKSLVRDGLRLWFAFLWVTRCEPNGTGSLTGRQGRGDWPVGDSMRSRRLGPAAPSLECVFAIAEAASTGGRFRTFGLGGPQAGKGMEKIRFA